MQSAAVMTSLCFGGNVHIFGERIVFRTLVIGKLEGQIVTIDRDFIHLKCRL